MKGMAILIREGSVSKDLDALAEILDENTSSFVALCTDDRNPARHRRGRPPRFLHPPPHRQGPTAASRLPRREHSAARIFGLNDRGLVAPGWRADIVLLDDLETCAVSDVISAGRLVRPDLFASRQPVPRLASPR
jgi:adenine deaminase